MCKNVFLVDTASVFDRTCGKYRALQRAVAQQDPEITEFDSADSVAWSWLSAPVDVCSFLASTPPPATCKPMSIEYREHGGWFFNNVKSTG